MKNIFSIRLKELRKQTKTTGQKLADALGCSDANVCQWERGRNYPNTDILVKIADYFNVSTDYLLGRTDDPRPVSLRSISDGEIVYIGDLNDDHKKIVKEIISSFKKGD